jgi:hypothetical protein
VFVQNRQGNVNFNVCSRKNSQGNSVHTGKFGFPVVYVPVARHTVFLEFHFSDNICKFQIELWLNDNKFTVTFFNNIGKKTSCIFKLTLNMAWKVEYMWSISWTNYLLKSDKQVLLAAINSWS